MYIETIQQGESESILYHFRSKHIYSFQKSGIISENTGNGKQKLFWLMRLIQEKLNCLVGHWEHRNTETSTRDDV